MKMESFTGGIFDTNCYLLRLAGGNVLIDAPQGVVQWLESLDLKVDLLLLTHAHIDHVMDAAEIKRRFSCPIAGHPDSEPLLSDPGILKRFGFNLEFEQVALDRQVVESKGEDFLGRNFQVFEVPGHCPGSLCFLDLEEDLLFGGDVLFAGGIGRWDLPGGDLQVLLKGIREKLMPLPDNVRVLPGHGPVTTIGIERRMNPYARMESEE